MKLPVVICALTIVAAAQGLKYRECGLNTYVSVNHVDLRGRIAMPSIVHIDFYTVINKDLPQNATLELQIFRIVQVFEGKVLVPIPCVSGLGSCTYNLCDFFTHKANELINFCPFWPEDIGCSCPITQGMIFRKYNVPMEIPAIPAIPNSLVKGNYILRTLVKNTKGETIYCIEFMSRAG